jgi:hypothetical protein
MRKKHGITLKYLDVQASTTTMNKHRHSRCHYKRNSGSTPARTSRQGRRARGPTTGGADDLVGRETFSGCHHLSTNDGIHLPTNTAPASIGHPQSAPAGPHSRPRRKNENGTVSEHEYCPRGVRHVVRPSDAAGHSRPDRGRNAAPWPGSSSSPSPAWLGDASSAKLEVGFHPRCRRKKRDASPREGRLRLASPSSPARMMKILEAEGGAEAAARLASPHHQTGGHHPG